MKKNIFITRFSGVCFQLFILFGAICACPVFVFAGGHGIIIAMGDSLTEGCDVYHGNCGWERSGNLGYEIELEPLLKQSFRDYTVTNFGLGGETAKDAIVKGRLESVINETCNLKAEYILILEGTNDLFHHSRPVDVKYFLGKMIDKSRSHGLTPLLATIPPDAEPSHSYKNIPLMNSHIRTLAGEKNVQLVELHNKMAPHWNEYTPGCYGDLLHPNAAGFKAMGDIWYESLAKIIPRRPPLAWRGLLLKKH